MWDRSWALDGRTLGHVLSLAKLRVGQEAYQLSGVAESLDAYYTGAGEAPGVWIGEGAAKLGLEGEVAADDLRAVLAGMRPGSRRAVAERDADQAVEASGAGLRRHVQGAEVGQRALRGVG